MVKYILNFILLIITLSACNDTPHYSEELLRLESRVGEAPDSVFCTLDSINSEMMTEADRALFINIKTEAADKLYKEHTTDSLIAEARTFFEKNNDMTRLAKAWYLTGRIHSDWEKWAMATEDFLKAKELTANSTDFSLRGRIADHLGLVNWHNYLYPEARAYYREAYGYYQQAHDTIGITYILKQIGETYMANYQADSAILMYKQALSLAELVGNRNIMEGIHHRLGYMYRKKGDYEQALFHLYSGLKYSTEKPYAIYNNIGNLYLQMNRLDSARFYLEQALEASYLPTLCLANSYLAELAQKEGNPEKAYAYQKKYEELADSLDRSKQMEDVVRLQQKQETKEITREHKSLLRTRNFIILGLMGLTAFFVGLAYRQQHKKQYYQREIKKLTETIRENEASIRKLQEQPNQYSGKNLLEIKSKEQIEQENLQLLEKFNALNREQCRRHSFLKKLYGGKKDILPAFEKKEWKLYEDAFHSIYPMFTESLKKSFPKLSEQEIRICQLSVMGVKTSKVADVLLLQADTVSSYKQKIKKSCFPTANKTLEELLLPFIIN